jgi:hypothetical protein
VRAQQHDPANKDIANQTALKLREAFMCGLAGSSPGDRPCEWNPDAKVLTHS